MVNFEVKDSFYKIGSTILSWEQHHAPFALYRTPHDGQMWILGGDALSVSHLRSIEGLNSEEGFVMAPFALSKAHEVQVIHGTPRKVEIPPLEELILQEVAEEHHAPSEAYQRHFEEFLEGLREGGFQKLVLSRREEYPWEDVSWFDTFLMALKRYPKAFVWMAYTPQTGLWLGASPEVILSGDRQGYEVVALAGTQPLPKDKEAVWNDKNRHEQDLVSQYIGECLLREGITARKEGPYTVEAGNLIHLKTEFHFSLPDGMGLGNLLKTLHPTPAVCGLPKREAYEYICRAEGYDRGYYSGFVGWLSPRGRCDLYVNLRSMNLKDERLMLYAGGGLLPASRLEEEWRETEHKLQTMKQIIQKKTSRQ